jgi:type II secretory pathway pseudopilin PulG
MSIQYAVGSKQYAEDSRQIANCELQIADCKILSGALLLRSNDRIPPTAYRLLPTAQRGISLLEVLICIGIVAIGLVSIAALLPVGGVQVQKANTEERKATLGLNAFREFQIRGMDNTQNWVAYNNSTTSWVSYLSLTDSSDLSAPTFKNYSYLPPVVIDPLMVAVGQQNGSNAAISTFPANFGTGPLMARLTLSSLANNASSVYTPLRPLADAVFTSADDVASSVPDDSTQPGTSAMIYQDAPTNTIPLKRDFNGQYTWLATITPNFPNTITGTLSTGSVQPPQATDQYTLSIVVFDRRLLTTPIPATEEQGQEEMVQGHWGPHSASFETTTLGEDSTVNQAGGEFTLSVDTTVPNATAQLGMVRPGQWLMLCRYLPATVSGGWIPWVEAKWYRVVAAGDVTSPIQKPLPAPAPIPQAAKYTRQITLAGPDWEPDPTKTAPSGILPSNVTWPSSIPSGSQNFNTYAVLLDGTVAVYQRVIHLESSNSVWSQ